MSNKKILGIALATAAAAVFASVPTLMRSRPTPRSSATAATRAKENRSAIPRRTHAQARTLARARATYRCRKPNALQLRRRTRPPTRREPHGPTFLASRGALVEITDALREVARARSSVAVLHDAFRPTAGAETENVLVIARVEEEFRFARRMQLDRAVARGM